MFRCTICLLLSSWLQFDNKNNNLAISDELIMINVVIIDSVSGTTFGVRMFDKKCLTSNSGLTND